jgi:glutaredoxin 3
MEQLIMDAVIYLWASCPFCVKAKALLDSLDISYEEHDISGDREALSDLREKTGMRTVPQIWVKDTFIGGCDELHHAHNEGKLLALVGK